MPQTFDVVVIGAGSVGVPIAWALAEKKMKVCVIESAAGPGQGQNKAAIGGIRATHSDAAKVWLCQESLEEFQTWEARHGEHIGWLTGGYCFPCYSEKSEAYFKKLLSAQRSFGLNIDWLTPEGIEELSPGIARKDLRGGTFSPDDGFASPMLSSVAFYRYAKQLGVQFFFNQEVTDFVKSDEHPGRISAVKTNKDTIYADHFVLANGANARDVGAILGLDLPVYPDSHEAGITEPVERFFEPMLVDIRAEKDSKNYYFYQNAEGQVVFCISPDPIIPGKNRNATSSYLPLVCRRMVQLFPKLANLKIRRTWRGLYPMTPDGQPIISAIKDYDNLKVAIGMCGQGYMLGPGVGRLFARWFTNALTDKDKRILDKLTLYGDFSVGIEELK